MVRYFSRRYIAGETLQSAINIVKDLNSKGIYATLDVLGEAVKNKEEAIAAKKEILKSFDAIVENIWRP